MVKGSGSRALLRDPRAHKPLAKSSIFNMSGVQWADTAAATAARVIVRASMLTCHACFHQLGETRLSVSGANACEWKTLRGPGIEPLHRLQYSVCVGKGGTALGDWRFKFFGDSVADDPVAAVVAQTATACTDHSWPEWRNQ